MKKFLTGIALGLLVASTASAVTADITQLSFTSSPQTIFTGVVSSVITVQTQNVGGTLEQLNTSGTVLELNSSSPTGEFSSNAVTWASVATLGMNSGTANKNFYYKDSTPGTHTLTITAQGQTWAAAVQTIVVNSSITNSESESYATIQEAVDGTDAGGTVTLNGDVTTSAQVTIDKPLTLDGNGHTLFAPFAKTSNSNNSAIGIIDVDGTVIISDLTIDGTGSTGSRHGINTYKSSGVVLNNVTISNNNAAGLIVNGSNVTATDLNTSGNVWYAVNVDPGSGVTEPSVFTLNSGTLGESRQIWSDGTNVTETATVTVNAEGYTEYSIHGTSKKLWSNKGVANAATIGNVIYSTIQAAITAATEGDTVNVGAGTYTEVGQILINKNLTIIGDVSNKPIIHPTGNFTGANAAGGWWLVESGITFNLSNVVLDGNTSWINRGLRSHGNTAITNVDFRRIRGSLTGSPYQGFAILGFGGTVPGGAGSDSHGSGGAAAHLTITNSTFSDIGRVGVLIKGTESTATITGNTYTGKGDGDFLDYGFEIGAGGSATISGNTITGNRGIAADTSTSAGVLVTDFFGEGTNATVSGNTFSNNSAGLHVGYLENDESMVVANENNFAGEVIGVKSTATTGTVNAEMNWWGTTDSAAIAVKVVGDVDFTPWYAGPAITLNGGASVSVFSSNGYEDEGATATDLFGSSVAVTDNSDSFNFSQAGTYTITYTATDSFGNTATATRTVSVRQASSGGGGGGNSAGAASSQALAAVNNAGVTLPGQAALVVGQVLGAETIAPTEFVGQVLSAADVSVLILSAQAISSLSPIERQVHITTTKSVLVTKITQLIGILQAELAAAIQAGNQ